MELNLISAFITAISLQNLVHAGLEHRCTSDMYARRGATQLHICGRGIRKQLEKMCSNGVTKKRAPGLSQLPPPSFLLSKDKANRMLSTHKRQAVFDNAETGISCECCINRCSTAEMSQYCRPGSSRKRNTQAVLLKNGESDWKQQDVENFYDSFEKVNQEVPFDDKALSNVTQELIKFNSNPLVRALMRNKLINSMIEERHHTQHRQNKNQEIQFSSMKDYNSRKKSAEQLLDREINFKRSHIDTRHHLSPQTKRLLYKLLNKT